MVLMAVDVVKPTPPLPEITVLAAEKPGKASPHTCGPRL